MSDEVATGFWYNWEHGKFRGATLTLPTTVGLVLVSFLTLWVQFAGACFWRVLCFVIHQIRSSTAPHSGLFHQQQIILRNSVTAPNALWSFARSAVAWRGRSKAIFRDTLPLLITAICTIGFFSTASLLSSKITSLSSNQALLKSESCGFPKDMINVRNTSTTSLNSSELLDFNALVIMGRLTLSKSMTYARTCYASQNAFTSAECSNFVQPILVGVNSSVVDNTSCPFGNNACAEAAVRYDSGHIHSNIDLGLNSPRNEALTMRRVTTCAPINATRYATEWRDNVPEAFGRGATNTSVKLYEFGRSLLGSEGDGPDKKRVINCDATYLGFVTNETTFCVSKFMKTYFQQAYTIRASTVYQDNADVSDFFPIPDFQVPNADVTLISIFTQAKYIDTVNDTLFSAQNTEQRGDVKFALPSNDLSVLGCTEQYQLCNAATEKCTELAGLYKIKSTLESDALKLTRYQTASANILWKTAWGMALQWACEVLSDSLLLAQDSLFTAKSQTSAPLQDGHWQREAWQLHNMSLAVMQRRVYEHASPGNFTVRPGVYSTTQLATPQDAESRDLCKRQKTRSNSSISISVMGMSIILIVGALFILLDWFFIQQIFWFRSFSHERSSKKADWTSGGTLQLQRQVLESRGVQGWKATTQDMAFPVLLENERVFRHLGLRDEGTAGLPHIDTGYGTRRRSAMMHSAHNGDVEYVALSDFDKGLGKKI
ncbi:unnamed protein product [Periconia digitata]|uniref:Uncharacterized protein n=1 Tax=Periconia digitata TaxID=1303443 RepID=A0A9W4U1J5_9PLEO|nr:unnamed protein product [Periconia digitata]